MMVTPQSRDITEILTSEIYNLPSDFQDSIYVKRNSVVRALQSRLVAASALIDPILDLFSPSDEDVQTRRSRFLLALTQNLKRDGEMRSIRQIIDAIIPEDPATQAPIAPSSKISGTPKDVLDKTGQAGCAGVAILSMLWDLDMKNTDLAVIDLRIGPYPSRRRLVQQPVEGITKKVLGNVFRDMAENLHKPMDQSVLQRSATEPLIHAAAINYRALKRLCGISIRWTSILAQHLELDPQKRYLYIFRHPTVCALTRFAEQPTIPDILMRRFLLTYQASVIVPGTPQRGLDAAQLVEGFNQEILFSYRLIFGQHKKAAALFRQDFGKHPEIKNDPLLWVLCTKATSDINKHLPVLFWPKSCTNVNAEGEAMSMRQLDVYSLITDFPLLGGRLQILEQYSLRQKPSRIRDVWRDTRSPLQWYTFWAVIVFGFIAIPLGIIQIAIGIAQLIVAVKQLNQAQSPASAPG